MDLWSKLFLLDDIELCLIDPCHTVKKCGVCGEYWELCIHFTYGVGDLELTGYDAIMLLLEQLCKELD